MIIADHQIRSSSYSGGNTTTTTTLRVSDTHGHFMVTLIVSCFRLDVAAGVAASVVDAIVEDSALRGVGETEEFHRIPFPSLQVQARNQFLRHPFAWNASVNPFSGAIT